MTSVKILYFTKLQMEIKFHLLIGILIRFRVENAKWPCLSGTLNIMLQLCVLISVFYVNVFCLF